jgi:hypothetical protein
VDKDLIFFGPCKKLIRTRLRKQFLEPGLDYCDTSESTESIYIVGVNGSNPQETRKVIWAGRLSEVMTFAEATRRLRGDRFQKLRDHSESPLHVRPIMDGSGSLIGYEHVSNQHIRNGEWVKDLVSPRKALGTVRVDGRKCLIRRGTAREPFDRDCCLLLENCFFAQGQGIGLDEEALSILRQAQPGRSGIDGYAVFGRTANGQAIGRRGTFLEMSDDLLANRFVQWLKDRSRTATQRHWPDGNRPTTTRCGKPHQM